MRVSAGGGAWRGGDWDKRKVQSAEMVGFGKGRKKL